MSSILDKERIVAGPGFNRWLVPPAALAIHLSIGMAYGFSVFWLPLSRATGIPCPNDAGFWVRVFSPSYDWSVSMLGWMYTLFFVFLGGSAAVFGRWVEQAGPRKAGLLAACCWGGGLVASALGVYVHQIWLLWLGAGVLGGVGLGLGYISPVSTLLKWFPDRRGMATGLAIMGFGGGAMVGAPFANRLMTFFATADGVGVWQTFFVLGGIYFTAMTIGAFGYRLPPPGWTPGSARTVAAGTVTHGRFVPVTRVHRTPQFWLTWGVLCLNVSAGIGVLGMASPMIQEVFGEQLASINPALHELDPAKEAKRVAERRAEVAAAFTGLLSLFNIVGRIAWASFSDYVGRKATYTIFFLLGALLYAAVPWTGQAKNVGLFVAVCCVILTMYGGGFAAIPAYLADLFGSQQISAIHGRLLTAWSVAGVVGPVAVNYLRDWQRDLPASERYNTTMYLLTGMLLVGLVCNLLIRPVHRQHFEELAPPANPDSANIRAGDPPAFPSAAPQTPLWLVYLAWAGVGIPMLWGMWKTLTTAWAFFE